MHRALGVVVATSFLASGLTVAGAAVAAAAPAAPTPPPVDSGKRPDDAAASAAARSLGRRVEVTGATTETVRKWANADGTFTEEVDSAPARARRGDGWVPIDTALAARDGAIRPAATLGDVRFSDGGDTALAAVTTQDGGTVALAWPDPLPVPTIAADAATYEDVLPGIDLEMKAVPAGYEQSFILKTPAAAATTLRVPLETTGVTPVTGAHGISFRDASGTDRAWVSAARMWDATGRDAPVTVTVEQTPGGASLRMTPDEAFLADPSLVYPVTVDPVVTVYKYRDAYISSTNTTANYGSNAYLKVGLRGSTQYVSYLEFPFAKYAGKHITDATLSLGATDSVTCSARTTSLYAVTTAWYEGSVTWDNRPTTDLSSTGALASSTQAGGGPTGSTCEPNTWVQFNDSRLTARLQAWADDDSGNHGMSIRASSTDSTAAKDFASGENTSWTPRVSITYNNYPDTVAARSVTPAVVAADGTRYAPTLTPVLAARTCDADGSPLRYDYEVWNAAKTSIVTSSGTSTATVPSCTKGTWTVPSGTLTNGTTYYWRTRAYDGTDYSTSWSGWVALVPDTTVPNAPTLSSTTYPENQWSPGGSTATMTVGNNGSTDVIGYYYGIDELEPTTYGASVVVTSPADGPHTLRVRSVDRAGNTSAVRSYAFGVGAGGVTSPAEGARTEKFFPLDAETNPGWETLTWMWRRAATDSWTDIGSALTVSSAGDVASTVWDAAAAAGADGAFQLAARLAKTGASPVTTQVRSVSLDRADFGTVTATEAVGPASVNLFTGNLAVSATDVSFAAAGSDLTVSRTFNSRADDAAPNGPFGPGWVSSVPVESAGSAYTGLAVSGSLVTVTMDGGDTVTFTKADTAGGFTPEYGAEDLTLTYVSASDRYDLEDVEGNVTGFTKPTNATSYVPSVVTEVGAASSTSYAYESHYIDSEWVTRVTGIMAPKPAGLTGTCSLANPTALVGCRSLKLTYSADNVPAPGAGQVGDYPHRLKKVEAIAYDPDQTPLPGMRTIALAEYAYDSSGRLAQEWDPRLPSLKTTYTYNGDGQLATITPPAEEAWTFAYESVSGEPTGTGRLKSVSRPTLLSSPATAVTMVVYDVKVTTAEGGPYDLSAAELARAGQTDLPRTATAVFPPDTAATFGSGSLPAPSSYDRATLHYLNADGREVNTVDPNGGVTTTEHDARGNVVRTLTAGNRQRALDRGATAVEEAAIAQTLSTVTVYSADGLEVKETFGPEHDVTLTTGGDPVRGREHTAYTYDEGMTSGGPYHLATKSVTGVRVAGETTDRASESRTTKTEYGTTTAQWALGQPTATIVDPAGLSLATRTTYTADGRVLTQTLPAGGTSTSTAATRVTRYYSEGVDAVDAACGLRPEWVGLACSTGPGGQPSSGLALPVTYTTYDMSGRPRVVTEKAGGTTLRTTTTTYDSAGRPWKTSVTASAGTGLPVRETYYDSSGRPAETRSLDALGAVTARVTRVFDSLGRLTGYTDADGNVSSTTYDVLGRPVVASDGKGTQTFAYDGGSERRGLVTSLVDSHAGTWTATYDVDGTATVDWPNGLRETRTVDEAGSATALAYAAVSGCSGAACTVFAETVAESAHGQWLSRSSTLSAQAYAYDAAGRLTEASDTVDRACTVRRYAFDGGGAGNSNRTRLETFGPAADNGCQTSSAASTFTSAFDEADRLAVSSGAVYDALGRTTTVPDAQALGSGALTVGYHVNDLVRSIGIAGGATQTYTLDVDAQRVRSWTDGTTTRRHHYDGDADNPGWTEEGSSAWTRNVGGIAGDLAAVYDSAAGAATLQLTNLHGDVVATATTIFTALASTMEATEYGAPRGDTGTRYAWLGGKQRAADTPGGLSLMGVRLYNPATGRFLQIDPVYGGNDNPYVYPTDPLTEFDLDGRCLFGRRKWGRGCKGGVRWMSNTFNTAKRAVFSTHQHLTLSFGGCSGYVFYCVGLTYQHGRVAFSRGWAGSIARGPSIGWNTATPSQQNAHYGAACVYVKVGGCGYRGRRSNGKGHWYGLAVGPGLGLQGGRMKSRMLW